MSIFLRTTKALIKEIDEFLDAVSEGGLAIAAGVFTYSERVMRTVGRGLRYGTLGGIALGWVATPAVAGLITFVGLFFLQNVFGLVVHHPAT